jgi:hypothetical protein
LKYGNFGPFSPKEPFVGFALLFFCCQVLEFCQKKKYWSLMSVKSLLLVSEASDSMLGITCLVLYELKLNIASSLLDFG